MDLSKLINENALITCVNNEVERLFAIKVEEFKKELSGNYSFDDYLLNRVQVSNKLGISIRQVDTLTRRGKLKKCSLGRGVKFRNSDVLEYIKSLK